MGGHIADGFLAAFALAEQERTAAAAAAAPRRVSALTDENVVLEEERGNPSILNEGYVVVRKRDLY